MTRHLAACEQRKQAEAAPKRGARPARLFHLVVEGRDLPMYWLHLALPTTLPLSDLDAFLRAIWLECCGHLSAFEIDRRRYLSRTIGGMIDIWEPLLPDPASQTPVAHEIMVFGEDGALHPAKLEKLQSLVDAVAPVDLGGELEEIADADMDVALGDVLAPGKQAFYEYDFGTTTNLVLKVVAEIDGWTTRREPIQILARNDPPEILCDVCQQPAALVCAECVWNGEGWLCKRCSRKHPCGEEMLLPVVNSPRVGMCAYTG